MSSNMNLSYTPASHAASASSNLTVSNNMSGSTTSLATTPATTPTTLTTTSAKRLGYASPSTSVICEEVFDEACQPSHDEINDYAKLLGIDTVKETHLLYLAKEGLMAALPSEWKICYSEEKCGHYYYNTKTKQSQWDHPLDAVYRELVEQQRQKTAANAATAPATATATAATPIVDNSDDASQLDSGIRSLQGTDEFDTTTNTNEMSSPVQNGSSNVAALLHAKKSLTPLGGAGGAVGVGTFMNAANANGGASAGGGGGCGTPSSGPNSNSTTSTSGFSGGVSRFLESRSKNLGSVFMPVKNTRFEVAKTNPQISLAMKFGGAGMPGAHNIVPMMSKGHDMPLLNERKTGFQLSGTGAMFLKSRRQIETSLNQASEMLTTTHALAQCSNGNSNGNGNGSILMETGPGTPPGVKGILRDSSLTDMRRRIEREDYEPGAISSEENKRVRFNLDEPKLRSSPEEEPSSSRKLTQSPELSINDSDDDAEGDDDNLWDEDDDDDDDANDCAAGGGVRSLDSSGAVERNGRELQRTGSGNIKANPFSAAGHDEKHIRDIRVISLPKAQTIQMLKAQSFSIELPAEHEHAKLSELTRSQSVETAQGQTANAAAVGYLDKLKDNSLVKPLYEDTDSDSKGSSVRSFIINKSEQDSLHSSTGPTNPFDLDELNRKHSRDVEQLQRKLQQSNTAAAAAAASNSSSSQERPNNGMRTLKMATKLVGFLKKDTSSNMAEMETPAHNRSESKSNDGEAAATHANGDLVYLKQQLEKEQQLLLKDERERLEEKLQREIDVIKREHEQKLKSIKHEYDLRLTSHQHQIEEAVELQLEEYRAQLEEELDAKRKQVVNEHKARMTTLQTNHAEILQDLERDLKSEEEILKKEHAAKLMQMRDKLTHELEMEKHRMRESGEDRLYEKVRCEKRLLEDKYRCLKEKYIRLKTDVKMSLERRNRRREAQAMHHSNGVHNNTNTNTTTGSETERSISNKPSIGNSDNRSLSYSTSCQDAGGGLSMGTASKTSAGKKPPVPPKSHLAAAVAGKVEHHQQQQQQQQHRSHQSQLQQQHVRDRSSERVPGVRKPGIASKYIKHLQVNDDTTSLSQSDTTISNNYSKGRYLPVPAPPIVVSDNGNSDSEAAFACNQENNNNSTRGGSGGGGFVQRKKLFSRTKSASTSRLNSDNNYKIDRPCTPVENLRHQLQKLEDLEDQFPENTLDTTYHLRYPFTDISNEHPGGGATSSELEFFKHRIHLERDSVRRAKESLRTQRTNFRARQREIKQHHKISTVRHTLDQLIQEEKELTEMEVNLHRTRALLGEKVIRLRHLEQSLMRIYEKEKPNTMEHLSVEPKDDAATLSDLSSHSSSGFSSTDFASGTTADMQNINKRKEIFQQESNECIQNLEILNAEIREILDILGQKRIEQHGAAAGAAGMTIPMISPSELSWSHMLSTNSNQNTNNYAGIAVQQQQQQFQTSAIASAAQSANSATAMSVAAAITPHSIPTLADRLETYRQLAAGRMQTSMGGAIMAANTIVSQSPRAVNYTTSLVERTRDLRNWLRQAKNEHELLAGISMQQQHSMSAGVYNATAVSAGGNNMLAAGSTAGMGGMAGNAANTVANMSCTTAAGAQTNL